MSDTLQQNILAGLLITRLAQPIVETEAYKFGIVDESGYKIREPSTIAEKASYTPFNAYIFKLRNFLGEAKLELLNVVTSSQLLTEISSGKFNVEQYTNEMQIKQHALSLVEDFKNLVHEGAMRGVSQESVENMILNSFIQTNEKD